MSIRYFSKLFGLAALAVMLAACAPRQDFRGAQIDEDRLKEVKVGVSTDAQVAALLGSPSTSSTFDKWGMTWYYISSETEAVAFMAPELLDQQVVAIAFDGNSRVKEVRRYGMKDGRQVQLVDRITPTKGREFGVLEQLFGNLGKFNSPTNATR